MDIDETLGALTDLVQAGKIRYLGSLDVPGRPDRRGAVDGGAARARAVRLRAAAVLAARARASSATCCPACERYGMGVIVWGPLAGGWLTGRYRKGRELPTSTRADRLPAPLRHGLPENQRKLEAAEALALLAEEAGVTLIHLAIAFVAPPSRRSPPRSSARGRWSSSRASSAPRRSSSRRACSTASTRSSRRERSSTRPTRATRPPWLPGRLAADAR